MFDGAKRLPGVSLPRPARRLPKMSVWTPSKLWRTHGRVGFSTRSSTLSAASRHPSNGSLKRPSIFQSLKNLVHEMEHASEAMVHLARHPSELLHPQDLFHQQRADSFAAQEQKSIKVRPIDPRTSRFMVYWRGVLLVTSAFSVLVAPAVTAFSDADLDPTSAGFIINRLVDLALILDSALPSLRAFRPCAFTSCCPRVRPSCLQYC